MEKLLKQLRRDLKKNPKKAGMLGLLFLALLYVCVPLFLPQEKKPVKKPTASAAATTVAGAAVPVAAAAAPLLRWQDLSEQLERDPRMKSAAPPATVARRNPFMAEVPEFDEDAVMAELLAEIEAEDEAARTISPSQISPILDSLPLVLSSTIVGGVRSRAVINGRVFDEGATIGLRNELPIVLTVIETRRVVIEWNGSRRELRILRPGETPTASLGSASLLQ